MKKLNYIISRIPILLFLSVVCIDLILTYVSVTNETYKILYYYMNEVLNAGIITNVFILLVVYRYKLCLYNKVSVFALIGLNIFNLIFISLDIETEIYHLYCYWFTHFLMVPTAMLSIILMIKKI